MSKAKYWWAVMYPENMRDDWEELIASIVQIPYAYCIHDKDTLGKQWGIEVEQRKKHLHLILVFNNTTTYKHALSIFDSLSKEGCKAVNTCLAIVDIKNAYEYLIHNTADCRKKGKYQYPKEERIEGNNFDIGSYIQVSQEDKDLMLKELCDFIRDQRVTNFLYVYDYVAQNKDMNYFSVLKSYSGLLERLTKANFQLLTKQLGKKEEP